MSFRRLVAPRTRVTKRDCDGLGNHTERNVRCPGGFSGLDDTNDERVVVFCANSSL